MADAARGTLAARRRVAIVTGSADSLLCYREPLIDAIAGQGHRAHVMCAEAGGDAQAALSAMGVTCTVLSLGRGRAVTLRDRTAVLQLRRVLIDGAPNVVLGLGAREMVLAGLAARRVTGARVVLEGDGLGAIAETGLSARWGVRRALDRADVLVVHSGDEQAQLRGGGLGRAGLRVHVMAGAAVDLVRLTPAPLPSPDAGIVFTSIARGPGNAAVDDFVQAAHRVRAKFPNCRFVVAFRNGTVPTVAAGSGDGVERVAAGDVQRLLAETHVFVHVGREPGEVGEIAMALACGRPVITTDVGGCRDAVDERVSGVVVPCADPVALAKAMESFPRRPEEIAWMGQAARRKAERRFDARGLVREMMEILELV